MHQRQVGLSKAKLFTVSENDQVEITITITATEV